MARYFDRIFSSKRMRSNKSSYHNLIYNHAFFIYNVTVTQCIRLLICQQALLSYGLIYTFSYQNRIFPAYTDYCDSSYSGCSRYCTYSIIRYHKLSYFIIPNRRYCSAIPNGSQVHQEVPKKNPFR